MGTALGIAVGFATLAILGASCTLIGERIFASVYPGKQNYARAAKAGALLGLAFAGMLTVFVGGIILTVYLTTGTY